MTDGRQQRLGLGWGSSWHGRIRCRGTNRPCLVQGEMVTPPRPFPARSVPEKPLLPVAPFPRPIPSHATLPRKTRTMLSEGHASAGMQSALAPPRDIIGLALAGRGQEGHVYIIVGRGNDGQGRIRRRSCPSAPLVTQQIQLRIRQEVSSVADMRD